MANDQVTRADDSAGSKNALDESAVDPAPVRGPAVAGGRPPQPGGGPVSRHRAGEHPPLTIGVTGHRILAEIPRIEQGISEALDRIEKAYPGRPLTLFSSLAEGADRLAAREALSRCARLVAPLPFSREDYETDFPSPQSVEEFRELIAQAESVIEAPQSDRPRGDRTAGYEAAGWLVADECDVLLAIWDCRPAQGRGGTAEIVARARRLRKPLVIVRAGNRDPETQQPTSLGSQQGRVITEGLPAPGWPEPDTALPSDSSPEEPSARVALLRQVLFNEPIGKRIRSCLKWLARLQPWLPLPFAAWVLVATARWPDSRAALLAPLYAGIAAMLALGLCWLVGIPWWWNARKKRRAAAVLYPDALASEIDAEHRRWDAEANRYRDRRAGFAVATAFLGPLAVLLLAAQVVYAREAGVETLTAQLLIFAEIAVISLSIATVYRPQPFGRAHETWIPARLRAELLRREFWLYIARIGPYLNPSSTAAEVARRLDEIARYADAGPGAARLKPPPVDGQRNRFACLLALEHGRESANPSEKVPLHMWDEELYGRDEQCDLPDPQVSNAYIDRRLLDQKDGYYAGACVKHQLMDEAYESMAALTLGFAGVLAILHFKLLGIETHAAHAAGRPVELAALVLPPVGAAFVALRSAFENHRLTHSYGDLETRLGDLEEIHNKMHEQRSDPARIQRFVLKTEALLSDELRRWWLIVWPERPRGGA